MFGLAGIQLYVFIFVAKIIEVSISTIRIILSSKGERVKSSLVGLVEITIWIYVAAGVLGNMQEDPIIAYVYIVAFSIGIYLGGRLEQRLSVGNVRVNAIVKEEHGKELSKHIRENDFAVTMFKGEGMKCHRYMLVMIVKRRRLKKLLTLIKEYQANVVIDYNDTSPSHGVYGVLRK